MHFESQNYNDMASHVYIALEARGIEMPSRNGPVLRLPGVTTMTVNKPWQRVNFCPSRDANPFFHLMEAMAMLGSHNSVPFLRYFAKGMDAFSDDGERYNAFYGERLRHTFGFDQLEAIINELRQKPESRQCVAQIWDPKDLLRSTKDKACNTQLMFSVNTQNELEMTSVNRSNDAVWGIVTGANVVHLSMFQEYVACALGLEMGPWTHVSNNLHVYTDPAYQGGAWDRVRKSIKNPGVYNFTHVPLFSDKTSPKQFDQALEVFLTLAEMAIAAGKPLQITKDTEDTIREISPFLHGTVLPVFNAFHLRKLGNFGASVDALTAIESKDWSQACVAWVGRRLKGQKGVYL
jgi:hypothetical protein